MCTLYYPLMEDVWHPKVHSYNYESRLFAILWSFCFIYTELKQTKSAVWRTRKAFQGLAGTTLDSLPFSLHFSLTHTFSYPVSSQLRVRSASQRETSGMHWTHERGRGGAAGTRQSPEDWRFCLMYLCENRPVPRFELIYDPQLEWLPSINRGETDTKIWFDGESWWVFWAYMDWVNFSGSYRVKRPADWG